MEVIRLRDEYIKLGQALKAAGLVESGVEAKATDTEAFHRHNIYCAPRKEFYTHENCLHEK